MRVLGLDLETSGLSTEEHVITEVAFVLKELGNPRPLIAESYLIWEDYYQVPSKENQALTGITFEMLTQFGVRFELACKRLNQVLKHDVTCIVAHNGENFDKPFLFKQMKDHDLGDLSRIFETDWLDSANDIEYPFPTKRLKYLAAEYGIPTPNSHMALFDVLTMLDVFERQDIPKAILRSKSPWITVRALVDFETKDKAKRARFMWETVGDKIYSKCWVKRMKECDFEKECEEADFAIVRIV